MSASTSPSAPAEPLEALIEKWQRRAEQARREDKTHFAAFFDEIISEARAALSVSTRCTCGPPEMAGDPHEPSCVSTSAPKETSEPRPHNRQHVFTPPNPAYCAICGYDEPDIRHVATPEPAEPGGV